MALLLSHIALATTRAFNAHGKRDLLYIPLKVPGKAPCLSGRAEHLGQLLLGQRAVLLEMEEDLANRRLLKMRLPVLIVRQHTWGGGVSLACPSHVEIRLDETGLDLLHALGMEALDAQTLVLGTAQVEEDFSPRLTYGYVQRLVVQGGADRLLEGDLDVWALGSIR